MKHNPDLTSSELANVWSAYMADSTNVCVMKHFLNHVQDPEVKRIVEYAKGLSESNLKALSGIFKDESIPIPQGFTDDDYNQEAPRLYSDTYYLRYLQYFARSGMGIIGMANGTSYRKDIRKFFSMALAESALLYERVVQLMEKKGIFVRSPFIPYPKKVDYIQEENFLAGYLTLHKRPLLAIEINHISNNIEANYIGRTLIDGFVQVAQTKEVRKHFENGVEIATEIIKTLEAFLEESHTSTPYSSDSVISGSTTPPFSEKMMVSMSSALVGVSLSNIGMGISYSMRSDIIGEYTQLMTRVGKYAAAGAKLAIKHGWMEKPPQTLDRDRLIN
ncbi:DUF3231 family protein [Aquibacillus salsiterrae]|uniref:DUF3231 family protein n=1 Tax=Aquibacillus salsiterrae TaxID=2950439 RepID=A0A9X3WHD0_9BACI|nr:DUF3231 family protein [Aquibacillus salsiterrae]MDC3418623.1 DUF3231 family protein [Aquibacillus salsiterrae]